MLSSENITLQLNTDFLKVKDQFSPDTKIIYSGSIDSLLDYKYGALDYRTLTFEKEVKKHEDYQGTSVMNYANQEIPFTRIHEPKHLHPERNYSKDKTLIIKEFSVEADKEEPYYPIGGEKNNLLYKKYLKEVNALFPNLIVGGRLGDYKYYDMHNVIEEALNIYIKKIKS
jgi:UDP-galactopyranose mutase